MTTLSLLLNTLVYFLETVKTYELKRTKSKGHDVPPSQPLKPSTELKSNDL